MLWAFFIAGLIGALGATIIFPILAARRGHEMQLLLLSPKHCPVRSLSVLIPAHNESGVIGATVRSVINSKQALLSVTDPSIDISITVAADACTDETGQEARQAGAEVKILSAVSAEHSKWNTLHELVRNCTSDIVVLADSGILWPRELLQGVVHAFEDDAVAAVAPAYRNPGGGVIERLIWVAESFIKGLEARAGGPVSVHGATVAYRREELLAVLDLLGREHWLNDDVVIPLALRSSFPHSRIVYASQLIVSDSPEAGARTKLGSEFGRRRRMVVGNAQWISRLLPGAWKANPSAAVLALRRVFRVLWCWWAVLLALPLVLFVAGPVAGSAACLSFVVAAIVAGLVSPAAGRLLDAAAASLVAPYYLVALHRSREVVWE